MFRLQQERTSRNVVIRLGSRRDMVAAIWEGITLIPDEITLAANGQIKDHSGYVACYQNPSRGWVLQAASPDRLGPRDAVNPAFRSGGRG